ERSKEARTFARLWDPMRDLVLSARDWPFAIKAQALALDPEDPLPGWQYRYPRPADCLTALAVTNELGLRAGRTLSRWCYPDYRRRFAVPVPQAHGIQSPCFVTAGPGA